MTSVLLWITVLSIRRSRFNRHRCLIYILASIGSSQLQCLPPDLNSAYHQIGLTERSKPLTAFATDWNLYKYTRVLFGIATGAQVLTRLLDKVFSDVKFRFVYNYLDDLVIYSD
jgi:hypothetical protein